MSHIRNHVSKGPKPIKKQSCKTEQLQNIISLRITDGEKKKLEKMIKSTSKSISDIMREAIDMWSLKRRKLCLD
jgi:16S rRNA U516 pseudouridylate synthase RsuA-like enzyme